MESMSWKVVSVGAGALAAIGMRQLVSAIWPGSARPPLNPADRKVDWTDALAWGIASGIGAGVARVVSTRGAATAWERVTGSPPPGINPA